MEAYFIVRGKRSLNLIVFSLFLFHCVYLLPYLIRVATLFKEIIFL